MTQAHTDTTAQQAKNGQKAIRLYVSGFLLSIILILAAYLLVVQHLLAGAMLYGAITVLALLQLFVQVACFLRLNARTEHDRWNLICFLFTLLIIAIVVTGSLWIMYNLNYNMVN